MINIDSLNWSKGDGLLPAIVQDRAGLVRMLGYMNRAALGASVDTGFVTFFSRSKGRLWMKGETSGNRLRIHAIAADCDRDSLLLVADPEGPTCHLGTDSCFGAAGPFFPAGLEQIVLDRSVADPAESYTARLLAAGAKRLAQKVGEEGLEVALAAVGGDRDELIGEVADLAFHLTVMMSERGVGWREVGAELERRHRDNIARASS